MQNPTIRLIRAHDPLLVDLDVKLYSEFAASRDEKLLPQLKGQAYTVFECRRLTRNELFRKVERYVGDAEKAEEAFRLGVVAVHGPLVDGTWKPNRSEDGLTAGELDKFGVLDIIDIGTCIYRASSAPKDCSVPYLRLPMSAQVLDGITPPPRSAALPQTEQKGEAEPASAEPKAG